MLTSAFPIKTGLTGLFSEGKSADPCYFLAESVNPPLFSFKSESALLEKFLWYIDLLQDPATNVDVVFMPFFYRLFVRQFRQDRLK